VADGAAAAAPDLSRLQEQLKRMLTSSAAFPPQIPQFNFG
jgi:hypothetical protein